MLDYLKQLDVKFLLAINGLHNSFLDECMLVITSRFTWIPLYALIIGFLFWKKKSEFWLALVFIIAAVVCSDLFASSFMKPFFHRLRPCHDTSINGLLYLLKDSCGGKYGFVSSHAANTFGLATFLFMWLGREYRWIELFFIWALLVSLSRVYLGVHYPFDILGGAVAGILIALIFYGGYTYVAKKIIPKKKGARYSG